MAMTAQTADPIPASYVHMLLTQAGRRVLDASDCAEAVDSADPDRPMIVAEIARIRRSLDAIETALRA